MAEFLLPLKDRRQVADGTMAFWFDTTGSDLTFEAGQNADYTLLDPPQTDAEGNTRTFSFASSPGRRDAFMIATRMRNTAFKNSLRDLPLGTRVKVVGPAGDMTLHEDANRPAVILAGGIGITPFRSMIEWVTEQRLPRRIFLFYANRNRTAAAFLDDLESWAATNKNLRFIATLTDERPAGWTYETGRIDAAMIRRYLTDLTTPMFYIAGPQPMAVAMKTMLTAAGVSKDSIRTEEFTGY